MRKELKITLYCILILIIIAVIWLMIGTTNPNIEIQNESDIENLGNSATQESNNTTSENDSFEYDVMKDLEGFFGNNNGYEDVEGEYGFNNPENE